MAQSWCGSFSVGKASAQGERELCAEIRAQSHGRKLCPITKAGRLSHAQCSTQHIVCQVQLATWTRTLQRYRDVCSKRPRCRRPTHPVAHSLAETGLHSMSISGNRPCSRTVNAKERGCEADGPPPSQGTVYGASERR
eukprot:362665-Chlamydomonas_euryale.AAC.7